MTADTDTLKRLIESQMPEPHRTTALRRLKTVVRDYEAMNARVLALATEAAIKRQ